MRRLIIDTATENCSVALFDGMQLVACDSAMLGRGHAEHLLPMIAGLPDNGRARHIHVNCGPGSFTGIRVGIAAAKALQFAWQVECSGYSSLSVIAHMARLRHPEARDIGVAILGGHGEYFVQQFTDAYDAVSPMASMLPADAVRVLDQHYVFGSASEALVALRGYGSAVPIWPDAKDALNIAISSGMTAATPIYGREADAKPLVSDIAP